MALVLILLLGAAGFAQQPPAPNTPVFRAGVSLVKVDTQVVDQAGRAVTGLRAEDFQVFDEGVLQPIVHFGHEAEPLDLLLLLDVSGSMTRHVRPLADSARSALQYLRSGDRAGLMLFARAAEVRQRLTADLREVEQEMKASIYTDSLGSGTQINRSIVTAAQYLARQPAGGRRALLIVTDNLSLNYRIPDEEVVRELYIADTTLNGILIGRQKHPDLPRAGRSLNPDFTPSDIFKLAAQTGGEAMEATKVAESFQTMIERIRARYSIQYHAPAAQPGLRRIRVELTPAARARHREVVIRARSGYYAAP